MDVRGAVLTGQRVRPEGEGRAQLSVHRHPAHQRAHPDRVEIIRRGVHRGLRSDGVHVLQQGRGDLRRRLGGGGAHRVSE